MEILLAQVSNGKLELGGIFDSLKVDLDKYNDIINSFKDIDLSLPEYKDFNTGKANWDAIAKAIDNCDETALSYFKDLDDGKGNIDNASASVEGMSAYLKESGKMFDLAAIKAKLLNAALNAGIFLIVSLAIQGIAKALDNWIHRVEKANEAMQTAVGEYNSAKSSLESINTELEEQNKQLDELLAKDKLTYAEKGQLEELQAITKELLLQQDIEERRAANAAKEAADKTVDAFEKQYGRYDNTEEDLKRKLSYDNFPMPEDENDVLGTVAAYIRAEELLEQSQKDFDNALENGEDTTWLAENLQFNIDAVGDYRQALDDNISDLWGKRIALEDEYNKAIEKRDSGVEPLTSSEKDTIETYETIYNLMRMVYEYTDPNTWKSMQIEDVFNTKGIEKTKEELVEMVKAGEFDENTLQSYPKLSAALEKNQVSASELCNELEALAEAEANVDGDLFNTGNHISAFDKAWANSFTSEDDKVKELGNTLLELAEKGRLTVELFEQADSTGYFKNLGISAEEAVSKINKLVDESKQLSSMASQISSISNALATKQEEGFVNADTLSGFDVEVRGLDSWDHFQEVLGSTTSSYKKCQEAANALATEWVNSSDFLRQLTDENEEYYKTQLKAMGVENYEEVIAYAQELNSAKEALAQASFDVATASADEVQALIDTGTYSAVAQQEIWNLVLAKQSEEGITLDTSADCQNLLSLAENAGVTGTAIELLTQLLEIYNNLAAGTYGTNAQVINAVKNKADSLKNQINDIFANGVTGNTTEIDNRIKVSPATKSSAKSAGKEAADAYLEAFEKELKILQTLRDQGVISEAEYLRRLRALYSRYFKDRKEYLDEFKKYEREYLEGRHTCPLLQ